MKRIAAFIGLLALLIVIPAAQASITAVVPSITTAGEIPGTYEVAIDIRPNSLNSHTRGEYVTCYITPSDGYTAFDIEVSTICLEGLPVLLEHVGIVDHDLDGIKELMVKFDRQAMLAIAEGIGGNVDFTLTGSYIDGATFFGIDSIHVVCH